LKQYTLINAADAHVEVCRERFAATGVMFAKRRAHNDEALELCGTIHRRLARKSRDLRHA
jgi:hypothetical protein